MKVSIVYWSGTGNTEAMANAALEGAKNAGAEVELLPVSAASADVVSSDVLLFGCPLCNKRMVSRYISSDSLVLLIAMRAPPHIIYDIYYTIFYGKSKEKTRGVNIR